RFQRWAEWMDVAPRRWNSGEPGPLQAGHPRRTSSGRDRELGPDGLALRTVAGPPPLRGLGHEEQTPPLLVHRPGVAQVWCRAAAVGDLTAERAIADQSQPDRSLGIADGVG